jgi:DTW domain-containing protein YfiP
MNSTMQSKRPHCPQCLRAIKACICACVRPVTSQVEVLILQHPHEVSHIKASARLLHLCLANSRLLVSGVAGSDEIFEAQTLHDALFKEDKKPLLLYPEEDADIPLNMSLTCAAPDQIRLVIIDGTWRKSRQMIMLNPILQSLPRLALSAMPASQYQIRHAHKVDQLSSLEAGTYALMQLEANAQKFSELLQAFEQFNGMQIQFGVQNLDRKKHARTEKLIARSVKSRLSAADGVTKRKK